MCHAMPSSILNCKHQSNTPSKTLRLTFALERKIRAKAKTSEVIIEKQGEMINSTAFAHSKTYANERRPICDEQSKTLGRVAPSRKHARRVKNTRPHVCVEIFLVKIYSLSRCILCVLHSLFRQRCVRDRGRRAGPIEERTHS